jgi:hypothetical protein
MNAKTVHNAMFWRELYESFCRNIFKNKIFLVNADKKKEKKKS